MAKPTNTQDKCEISGQPIPPRTGMGPPRKYASADARDFRNRLSQLVKAAERIDWATEEDRSRAYNLVVQELLDGPLAGPGSGMHLVPVRDAQGRFTRRTG